MGVRIGLKLLWVPLGPTVFSLNRVPESTLVESCPGIPIAHTLVPSPPQDGWMSVDGEMGGLRPQARDSRDLNGPRNQSSNL